MPAKITDPRQDRTVTTGTDSSALPAVARRADAALPTDWGAFRCLAYESSDDAVVHIALTLGDVAAAPNPLVRVHSECLTGDVFGSRKCDCGQQFDEAMRRIAVEGVGVVVYMRGHEGRGIGILQKLRAYELQDQGLDTVDANVALGLPIDGRDYADAAAILADLGIERLRLLTNNPAKVAGLRHSGLDVTEQVPIMLDPHDDNLHYLLTKRDRMGHLIPKAARRCFERGEDDAVGA